MHIAVLYGCSFVLIKNCIYGARLKQNPAEFNTFIAGNIIGIKLEDL